MSWFWMVFFLVLSAVAVGIPFLLFQERGEAADSGAPDKEDRVFGKHRIEEAIKDLDLDLGAGKLSAEDHAIATADLLAELARLDEDGHPA